MDKQLTSVLCAGLLFLSLVSTADAALVGTLPATPGGTDYQAYYHPELDITWAKVARFFHLLGGPGEAPWQNTVGRANVIDFGVPGWRLPSMDVNGDNICGAV